MQQLTSKQPSLPLQFLLSMQQRYWQHHKSISASINFLICKYFVIDGNFQEDKLNRSLNVVDSFVKTQLLDTGFNKIRVIEWINSLLFNIVSMNQDFEQQISHSLSCNSNSSSNKKIKQDDSILLIQNLQQSQKQCFRSLLNLSSILQIVSEFGLKKQNTKVPTAIQRAEHEVQFTLMSTIQYLCSKMEIIPTYLDDLCQKLEVLETCECGCKQAVTEINENIRTRVNNVLFGQENEAGHQSMYEMLKKNYNGNMRSIASLIDANYYRQQATRPIFSGSLYTGMELLYQIIRKLVQFPKNSLFSQQMLESNQLFQLFMSTLEFRHINLYANWLKILLLHINNQNKSMNNFVKSISDFLYGLLVEHQDFVHLIRLIGKQLLDLGKYNKNIIVDLLKKLVLNRFLLNPQLFFDYALQSINQQSFSIELNKIRLMFYPKKAQNPEMVTSCQKLESIFYTIVFPANQKVNLKSMEDSNSKCVIYRLDQSLKRDYQSIYQDYLLKQHEQNQSNRGHTLSNSSYSLSFSFVRSPKQSNTKAQKPRRYKQQLTAKKMASPILDIPSQNCSMNTILHRINGSDHFQEKSPFDLGSPVSQKSKKTVLTEHTDVPLRIDFQTTMIEQLVERRRLLGAAIRNIERRKHRKVEQRKKIGAYLDKTHNDFEIWRRQVESLTNRVRIEIQLL